MCRRESRKKPTTNKAQRTGEIMSTLKVYLKRAMPQDELRVHFRTTAINSMDNRGCNISEAMSFVVPDPFIPFSDEGLTVNNFPVELVGYVTFRGMLANGCRKRCGEYRFGQSVIVVDNIPNLKGESFCQSVEIGATTVEDCREAYNQLRQGELWPTFDYETEPKRPEKIG